MANVRVQDSCRGRSIERHGFLSSVDFIACGTMSSLTGTIPAARVHELQQRLPGLTGGEGVLESAFSHYQLAEGTPSRPRTDADPLDREVYLLRVQRRV